MLQGWDEREKYEREKKAELALWIVQPFVKKQITIETFIGKEITKEDVEAAKTIYEKAPDTIRR